MKKSRFIILSVLSAMALTSCSLFKDDDIVVENHFNEKGKTADQSTAEAKIGDVESQRLDDFPNTLVFKNIVYSNMEGNKIENTYTTAKGCAFNVNSGNDYDVDKNNNNFDLYVPDNASKTDDINIVLFIHGGAWVSGLKTHVNPYVKEFAKNGYIAATLEYTLLNADVLDETKTDKSAKDSPLSVFRDLDEIDACITTMKESLKSLGFNESKLHLVLGGASSGAHLAMLYAYSRYASCELPIKFLIDVVGPTDINPDNWKAFVNPADAEASQDAIKSTNIESKRLSDGLADLPVSGMGYRWNEYQTMRIANGMAGVPYSLEEIETITNGDKTAVTVSGRTTEMYKKLVSNSESAEKLLSVTYHLKNLADAGTKIPVLCAYAGKDAVVGVAQYANLENAFSSNSYTTDEYDFTYFMNCGHVNLDTDTTTYNAFIAKILNWMATK